MNRKAILSTLLLCVGVQVVKADVIDTTTIQGGAFGVGFGMQTEFAGVLGSVTGVNFNKHRNWARIFWTTANPTASQVVGIRGSLTFQHVADASSDNEGSGVVGTVDFRGESFVSVTGPIQDQSREPGDTIIVLDTPFSLPFVDLNNHAGGGMNISISGEEYFSSSTAEPPPRASVYLNGYSWSGADSGLVSTVLGSDPYYPYGESPSLAAGGVSAGLLSSAYVNRAGSFLTFTEHPADPGGSEYAPWKASWTGEWYLKYLPPIFFKWALPYQMTIVGPITSVSATGQLATQHGGVWMTHFHGYGGNVYWAEQKLGFEPEITLGGNPITGRPIRVKWQTGTPDPGTGTFVVGSTLQDFSITPSGAVTDIGYADPNDPNAALPNSILLSAPGALRKRITFTGNPPSNIVWDVKLGDADGDNAVTIFDNIAVSTVFGAVFDGAAWLIANASTGVSPEECDFDGDKEITIFDVIQVSENFDLVGDD